MSDLTPLVPYIPRILLTVLVVCCTVMGCIAYKSRTQGPQAASDAQPQVEEDIPEAVNLDTPNIPGNSGHLTKHQLTAALLSGGPLILQGVVLAITTGVDREDGSGHCFTVKGYLSTGQSTALFLRTID